MVKDIANKKFGRLVAIKRVSDVNERIIWLCRCECGTLKKIRKDAIISGHTKSCGCLYNELRKNGRFKHGLSHHPLYGTWYSMIKRCFNVNDIKYKRWGGRGISVCSEWKSDYITFYNWAIANGWKRGLQIDRINNDGNYTPANCRFVTPKENIRNSTVSKITKKIADQIRFEYETEDIGYKRLGERHGISWSNVRNLVKRQQFT